MDYLQSVGRSTPAADEETARMLQSITLVSAVKN